MRAAKSNRGMLQLALMKIDAAATTATSSGGFCVRNSAK
jgi:hypothetical protein